MKRTFYVAGVQFRPRHEIDTAAREMMTGMQLGLVPEPTNKFDPNAVKIEYNTETADGIVSTFLGYVPKKFSSEVSAMLGIGAPINCTVDEVNPSAKTYEMIKVTVAIPIEEEEDDAVDKACENDSYEGDML